MVDRNFYQKLIAIFVRPVDNKGAGPVQQYPSIIACGVSWRISTKAYCQPDINNARREIMNRASIFAVLLISVLVGCSSLKFNDPLKAFEEVTHGYRQAISWSEFMVAATFLKNEDDAQVEEQIKHLDNFKVTAYELRTMTVVEEDVRVRQVVKISYFKKDDLVVKSMADDQLWEYNPELRTWQLTTGLPKLL